MRILGLDLGSVTCGVAISDALGMIARRLVTLRFASDDYEDAFHQVSEIIKEQRIETIVLGLPKHMNGDVGIRGEISIAFQKRLESLGVQVILWDERLTTAAAQRILIAGDVSRKKRKKLIDQMAAVQILQSYLDSQA
ncbi:MAG: Holliday junction resolvase RuvX [Erysipelotrichaceae bacterium]|nr:Holliday junction resolvase RuvX [Erysipelotrichaceae bacterium]MCI9312743.1 Holliday junction resolvase RuvX [Erysipelotrichaceae bacterium]